jgi:rubredoxin
MAQTAICPRCGRPTTVHVWFTPHDDPGHVITVHKCGICGYQWREWIEKPDNKSPIKNASKCASDTKDKPPGARH